MRPPLCVVPSAPGTLTLLPAYQAPSSCCLPTTTPCCLLLPATAGEELRERGLGDDDAMDSLVLTEGVLQDLALLAPWLKEREPFLLVRQAAAVAA